MCRLAVHLTGLVSNWWFLLVGSYRRAHSVHLYYTMLQYDLLDYTNYEQSYTLNTIYNTSNVVRAIYCMLQYIPLSSYYVCIYIYIYIYDYVCVYIYIYIYCTSYGNPWTLWYPRPRWPSRGSPRLRHGQSESVPRNLYCNVLMLCSTIL